jgi:hypothetical protein
MNAVFGDAGLVEADKLTYDQLADHLPEILDGICTALEACDLEQVEPAIERDTRMHGKVRWQQGSRIDELVHELDLFRQVLADAAETFAASNDAFTRRHEGRARRLIDEALVTSIREVVTERDRKIDEYTGRKLKSSWRWAATEKAAGICASPTPMWALRRRTGTAYSTNLNGPRATIYRASASGWLS